MPEKRTLHPDAGAAPASPTGPIHHDIIGLTLARTKNKVNSATKILLIGDSAEDLHAQGRAIVGVEPGWQLEYCESGHAALEKIPTLRPHCIILDCHLPDMSGLACFQAVRKDPENIMPVLLLAAQDDQAAAAEALRLGVQDYLFKDPRENYLALLPAVLKKTLREHRSNLEKKMAQAALSQLSRKYEHLFFDVTDGIILSDENRIIESINPAACRIFGYEAHELCGQSVRTIMHASDHARYDQELNVYLKTGSGRLIGKGVREVRGMRKSGQLFPLELAVTEISFDGRRMFAGVMRDVSEKHQVKEALLENEARFRGAFDNAPIGMALISLEGQWLKVNQALCKIVGYQEDELLGMTVQQMTHADDLGIDQTFIQLVLADQLKTYQMETRYFHKNGHAVPVMFSSSLVRKLDGQPLYFISKVEDITQRKQMENALFAEKDLAQTTLQSIGDAVITTDVDANITYMNPIAERLTGWSNKDACGMPLDYVFVIVNESTREAAENPVKKALAEARVCTLASNTILISRDGIEYYIDNSAAPIRVKDGNLSGVVMVFHDVTEARALSHKISYQASHDALTGLWNRSEFELTAARLLHSARVMHQQHALLYLDLDQFKVVNDTCGHLAGDQLLQQLSNLLMGNMRKSDTLARLGGDEFGILLEGCPLERAREIALHLIDAVRAFRFEWEGKLFCVGASIGLVAITDQTKDMQALLSAADTACYMAKDKGRNRVQVYERCDEEVQDRHMQMDWAARLQQAIAQDQFSLYCQKILSIGAGAGPARQHHEILLRYQDEHGRILLPMAFIPAAERYGLLASVDRWVIKTLLRHPPQALLAAYPDSFIAVNLSGAAITDPDFQEFLVRELQASAIPAARLCFEIAETAAISNLHRTTHFIQTMKALGCRFALDDFGSGLSSFAYLKSLPVDYLKIDGSIVKGIAKDVIDCAMVESIARIAKVLGIETIAKFVESEEVLRQLQKIGIDYGQGFGLHTPELLAFDHVCGVRWAHDS